MAVKRLLGDKETILCWRPHAGRLFQFKTGGKAAGPCGGMIRNKLWMQLLDLATANHARNHNAAKKQIHACSKGHTGTLLVWLFDLNGCVQTVFNQKGSCLVDVDGLTSPFVLALCQPPICFRSISLRACSVIRLYLLKGCGNIVVSVCLCASAVVPFFSSGWKRHQHHGNIICFSGCAYLLFVQTLLQV